MVDCGCCVVLITVTHWGLGLVVGYLVVLFGCTAIVWGFVNKVLASGFVLCYSGWFVWAFASLVCF